VALAVLVAVGIAVLGWGDRSADGPSAPVAPSPGEDVDVAPGAGEVELRPDPDLDGLLDDGWAVEPGSAAVVRPEDWSAADGSLGRSRPTCDVEGCALWRGTLLGEGVPGIDLAVGAGQAVAVRDGLLVAVDLDSGQLRWRVPRPFPDRQVHALRVDDRLVAVANGTTVTALDPRTGALRGTSTPLPFVVDAFARFDGQLVATGPGPDEMVAGLDDRAQVRFVRAGRVDALSADATTPLLLEHDDTFLRLDATTGLDRWRIPLDGRFRDGVTLLDRADGRIEVLDPRSGAPSQVVFVPGAVAAGVRSGVLVVVAPDRLLLVGRDGAAIGEVEGLDPSAAVVSAAGPRVTVVEVPVGGGAPRVEVRQVPGAASGLPGPSEAFDVPGTDAFGDGMGSIGQELGATRRRDGLLVASAQDAWVVPPGSAVATPVDVPVGARVRHVDGLSVHLLADGLELGGAGGRIGVRGAQEVLSFDPLLVRGPEGTLRLDRALLDG
jgi:outer membrane protein assembly factor BamB